MAANLYGRFSIVNSSKYVMILLRISALRSCSIMTSAAAGAQPMEKKASDDKESQGSLQNDFMLS